MTMYCHSQLVVMRRRAGDDFWHADPIISERDLAVALARAQRQTRGIDSAGQLDEFLQTLPQRIGFWAEIRNTHTQDESSLRLIDTYLERLRWVAQRATEESFLCRDGEERFHEVAVALRYGSDSAMHMLRGEDVENADEIDTPEDDLEVAIEEAILTSEELEFLIYQQRGTAVQFAPGLPSNQPRHTTSDVTALHTPNRADDHHPAQGITPDPASSAPPKPA
jgi:hypothetical protein